MGFQVSPVLTSGARDGSPNPYSQPTIYRITFQPLHSHTHTYTRALPCPQT